MSEAKREVWVTEQDGKPVGAALHRDNIHESHRHEYVRYIPAEPEQAGEASLSAGQVLGLVAAQAKVLNLHQECGDHYCEFHSGKEEEFAHECQTCDSIDRLRAAKCDLGELLLTLPKAAEAGQAEAGRRLRHIDEWHDDLGDVLWWVHPVTEPPYVGSPLCTEWPGYHVWWEPLPTPPSPPTSKEGA